MSNIKSFSKGLAITFWAFLYDWMGQSATPRSSHSYLYNFDGPRSSPNKSYSLASPLISLKASHHRKLPHTEGVTKEKHLGASDWALDGTSAPSEACSKSSPHYQHRRATVRTSFPQPGLQETDPSPQQSKYLEPTQISALVSGKSHHPEPVGSSREAATAANTAWQDPQQWGNSQEI